MKIFQLNAIDFEILRMLIKGGASKSISLSQLCVESKHLLRPTPQYIRTRVRFLRNLNYVVIEKEKPLRIKLRPETTKMVAAYCSILLSMEEVADGKGVVNV